MRTDVSLAAIEYLRSGHTEPVDLIDITIQTGTVLSLSTGRTHNFESRTYIKSGAEIVSEQTAGIVKTINLRIANDDNSGGALVMSENMAGAVVRRHRWIPPEYGPPIPTFAGVYVDATNQDDLSIILVAKNVINERSALPRYTFGIDIVEMISPGTEITAPDGSTITYE